MGKNERYPQKLTNKSGKLSLDFPRFKSVSPKDKNPHIFTTILWWLAISEFESLLEDGCHVCLWRDPRERRTKMASLLVLNEISIFLKKELAQIDESA